VIILANKTRKLGKLNGRRIIEEGDSHRVLFDEWRDSRDSIRYVKDKSKIVKLNKNRRVGSINFLNDEDKLKKNNQKLKRLHRIRIAKRRK
jgi:viroplasmin and RNaseH domain-containing protein